MTSVRPPAAASSPAPFLYVAWVLAFAGMLGSLFFSEVMKLPPCSLCWYQRICMYPLVAVLATGIVLRDRNVVAYAAPLALAGLALAVYHNLLYYGVIPETLSPCTAGVPCTSRQLELFGFVTIPLLGLVTFVAIVVCLWLSRSAGAGATVGGQQPHLQSPRVPGIE